MIFLIQYYRMFADYHVHSSYSDDSNYPMEQVVLDAIKLGLDEICFTDHVDYGIKLDWDEEGTTYRNDDDGNPLRNCDYERYFRQIEDLQKKYGNEISIHKGLEYGVQISTIDKYEKLYQKYPLDFVILSIHQVNDIEVFLPEFFANKTQREYNRVYYQELIDVMEVYKNYSVLGHIDSFNRYDINGICPYEEFKDLVDIILKKAIQDDKGIELNMSCVKYKLPDLTPCKAIIQRYYDLGGRIITIGSDSHNPGELAAHFDQGKAELRKIGFKEFCTFKDMKPIFHTL